VIFSLAGRIKPAELRVAHMETTPTPHDARTLRVLKQKHPFLASTARAGDSPHVTSSHFQHIMSQPMLSTVKRSKYNHKAKPNEYHPYKGEADGGRRHQSKP